MPKKANFRFYEELNDFLPPGKKKTTFSDEFSGSPSVKDAVEAIGVPHTEVDLILINGESVTFSHRIQDGDTVSVYPVFESLNISNVTHLREKPLRKTKFILDVHLGRLAKYLRMLGFDTLYQRDYTDAEIISKAASDKRIILTRDVGILKVKTVTHGYWVRSQYPKQQLKEIICKFDLLSNIKPFYRCMECNGNIKEVSKDSVIDNLEQKTIKYYNEFFQCRSCGKIYWKGSHYLTMQKFIEKIKYNGRS